MLIKIFFSIGAFPLSDVSLMTDEERETYLPTVKAFIKVLENDSIDQEDLNELIEEGEKIQELMPEHWKAIISQTINENFVEEIGRARRNQEAIANGRIRAQQQVKNRKKVIFSQVTLQIFTNNFEKNLQIILKKSFNFLIRILLSFLLLLQAQRSPVYSVYRPRKKSSRIDKLFKGVKRHLSKTFG